MLLIHSIDSSEGDERTFTMDDPSYGNDDDTSCVHAAETSCAGADAPQPPKVPQQDLGMPKEDETSKSAEKNQAEILKKLEDAFQQLTSTDDLETFLASHSKMKVMISINKLVELSEQKCAICGEGLHFKVDVKTSGSRVEITRKYKNGNCQKWVSSEVLEVKTM